VIKAHHRNESSSPERPAIRRTLDLASLNKRVFVNNASLGVYARVVRSNAYRDGKLGTWKRMLPEMLGRDAAARICCSTRRIKRTYLRASALRCRARSSTQGRR